MNARDNCTIGYSCGEACINTSYECTAEQASPESSKLIGRYLAGKTIPKPKNEVKAEYSINRDLEEFGKLIHSYKAKAGRIAYEAYAMQSLKADGYINALNAKAGDFDSVYDVSFRLQDSFSSAWASSGEFTEDEIKSATNAVRDATLQLLHDIPDNSLITASPAAGDGKGQKRSKLYKRIGFVNLPGKSEGEALYAIKRNGRLLPIPDYFSRD